MTKKFKCQPISLFNPGKGKPVEDLYWSHELHGVTIILRNKNMDTEQEIIEERKEVFFAL